MRLTQKQIGFVLDIIKEIKPGHAYMNHYKVKSMAVADASASRLLKNVKIQAYHKELLQKMEDASIASPMERKRRLTVFIREDNYTKFGLNRQGNVQAISELNKMEHIYTEGVNILNVNLDVRDLTDEQLSIIAGKGNTSRGGRRITEEAEGS